jgi:hypothetical protein
MAKISKLLIVCALSVTPPLAKAAEPSPWVGNDGQAAFQLAPQTMASVKTTDNAQQTQGVTKLHCNLESCTSSLNTANITLNSD